MTMQLSDFDYKLPKELIARYPLPKRSASRLLTITAAGIQHKQFPDLISLIKPNDLIVFNNTRVIPARLLGQKESGGRVEMLIERILGNNHVLAQIKASKSPKPGGILLFADQIRFQVIKRHDDLYELHCMEARSVLEIIETIGQIPLPPYFERDPDENDKERYQTIFAKHKGSVAAPTAGLHFDDEILAILRAQGVAMEYLTLHVGAGTFAPIRVNDIKQHRMHAEFIEVSQALCEKIQVTKARGGRVIAVGTTTARSLETASLSGRIQPFRGDTTIFIYPGFEFRCVDVLVTNFHLPQSTLLMLVCALGGFDRVMQAYREAVREEYRFFSYGDAMWVQA